MSDVYRALPSSRALAVTRGVGVPITAGGFASSYSGVASSSTSVHRSSTRPSTTASVLISRGLIRPPP